MRRIILIMVLVMVFSLAGMRSYVFAIDIELSRTTLRGLNGIYLDDVYISEDAQKMGLNPNQIQTDIELKLRLAGIKILPEKEEKEDSDFHSFIVSINAFKRFDTLIYNIDAGFYQACLLLRNPKAGAYAPTWSVNLFGIGDKKQIREAVKDLVDQFINAYLSVNPKK